MLLSNLSRFNLKLMQKEMTENEKLLRCMYSSRPMIKINKIRSQSELTNKIRKKNNQSSSSSPHDSATSKSVSDRQVKTSNKSLAKKSLTTINNNKKINLLDSNKLIKEDVRLKLNDIKQMPMIINQDESFQQEALINEKEFLKKISFKIRNELLDDNGKELLKQFGQSLSRTSTDPKHLTILHDEAATKIGNILNTKIFNNHIQFNQLEQKNDNFTNIFIEMQPGFGLITQKLIEANKALNNRDMKINKKFILIESYSKFLNHLNELKSKFNNEEIHLLKNSPFKNDFLFKKSEFKKKLVELISFDNTKLSIFGIVPWNLNGFLSKLYGDYASDRCFFDLSAQPPDFYLYVNELFLSKINPNFSSRFSPFKYSGLGILSAMFSKIEVIDEQKCDYFFPYPLKSSQFYYNRYPYNKLDLTKMNLIRIRFINQWPEEQFNLIQNKRLFYLFIQQLFIRPSIDIKDGLISCCTDADLVCKEISLNKYTKVNKVDPWKYFKMFEYLCMNKNISMLNNLYNNKYEKESIDHNLDDAKQNRRKIERIKRKADMKSLKEMNLQLAGQFKIPD